MNKSIRRLVIFTLCLSFVLAVVIPSLAQGQQAPPEYKELVAATQIKDAAARLKEFERIKSAYPSSRFMTAIDFYILNAKVELAATLEEVLALQKAFLDQSKGVGRIQGPMLAADKILSHPKLAMFDQAAVLAAVLGYRDRSVKAAEEPDSFEGVPANQHAAFKSFVLTGFDVLAAQAHLNAGDADKALAELETYKKDGGAPDDAYYYTLGGSYAAQGKMKEAYEAYLAAAAENHPMALAAARDLYIKINGKADGFEAAFDIKLKALPYHAEPFKAPAGWNGKTVLAELFTGSECPPCVAADLGFDGLIESYPAKYLAVLEYHLPIPRPDPMINAATKARQDYYGVGSTPTIFIDGDKDATGGGTRSMGEAKFKQYKAAIDGRVGAAPQVVLKLRATRSGDAVRAEYDLGGAPAGMEYRLALVQREEPYKGSNGLAYHKMIVRDLIAVEPATRQASFDVAASERAADAYLTEFENTNTRFRGYKFAERHAKIDRTKLAVVLFAQDPATKKVLNAVVAEVK